MLQPKEYLESRALSQSDLKLFRKNMMRFYREVEQGDRTPQLFGTKSTEIGDVVDCLTTNPEGLNDYKIVESVNCSSDVKTIMINCFSSILAQAGRLQLSHNGLKRHMLDLTNCKTEIIAAGRAADYQSRYGDDALFNTLVKNGGKYLQSLVLHYGSPIIDKDIYDQAVLVAKKMFEDPKIGSILNLKNSKRYRIHKQFIAFGMFSNTEQKGLIDIVIEDTKTKCLYPYDVKTSDTHTQFIKNYYSYGYGYQGSYYNDVLKQVFPDYQIMPFRFLVGPTKLDKRSDPIDTAESPRVYRMHQSEIAMFADGGFMNNNRRVIGWKETIREIEWHRKEHRWDHPKEYIEKGEIVIQSMYSEADDSEIDPL